MTFQKLDLIAVSSDAYITNPDLLILDICYYDSRQKHASNSIHRKLMEGEKATFTNRNLSFSFEDPLLHLSGQGRVIIRSPDFEHVLVVPQDGIIKIPFEFLAYKTDIQVTYLHISGKVVSGVIHVSGKNICQIRHCFLCRDIVTHFKCYPRVIQYCVYFIFAILILILLLCVKLIAKSLKFVVVSLILCGCAVCKVFKFIARCSLLLGAFIGSTIREIFHTCHTALERNAMRRANISTLPLVIMACVCYISTVSADCSTNTIVKSDLKSCTTVHDGSRNCKIFTTAEISLQSLSAENCLWFSDPNENHLFSLKLKLEEVLCTFSKERLYFTFPVTAKKISQISCIYNKFCGRGHHCISREVGKDGIHFEAETEESRQFPGFSACLAGENGNGCVVLTRPSCNFYRIWYEPNLLQSFEVSKITGHTCKYQISVTHVENNTISRLITSDTAFTDSGIKITVLGAYDQPHIHITEKLIQRVGNSDEAYLAPASDRNIPQSQLIGAIQANTSFTTDFIFSPDLTQCDYFEDTLRCSTAPDNIERLRATQEHALPLQRNIHLFKMNEGKLQSTQLLSSAVRIQLHFTNFRITVQTNTICPQLNEASLIVEGCYGCKLLARIKLIAHSSCQSGLVTIQLQQIAVHTKAIYLQLEDTEHTIKFQAERKCDTDKICLKSSTLSHCRTFKYCLDEPSVDLLDLNMNYTRTVSSDTSSNLWDWLQIPNLGNAFFILKFIGAALFIICLTITTLATVITCCCRSR